MSHAPDHAALARAIVDSSLYMTLATADADGAPWASPVYYAADAYRDFFWVSSPDATHSVNIAARSRVSIVIFDSRADIGTGQAVYMAARAEQVGEADVEHGIAVFSRASLGDGGIAWTPADVSAAAPRRLYRARVAEHSILDPEREGVDRRVAVAL